MFKNSILNSSILRHSTRFLTKLESGKFLLNFFLLFCKEFFVFFVFTRSFAREKKIEKVSNCGANIFNRAQEILKNTVEKRSWRIEVI